METVCEFCGSFRPLVYCNADAARLCLSCDAKVHSANALSNRHLRTLLCGLCNYQPCSVQCLEHDLFMCHGCNSNLHTVSSQHQRRMVSCFTSCPPAKEFLKMWGFRSNEVDDDVILNRFPSVSSDAGSSSQQVYLKGGLQGDHGFILQQIHELEKLQLTERNNFTLLMHNDEQTDISSVCDHPEEIGEILDHVPNKSHNRINDMSDLMMDISSSPFAQMEHDQLWYQNLQEISVREARDDDFNIPDIDLTFRNFEELFGADQEPIKGMADAKIVSSPQ